MTARRLAVAAAVLLASTAGAVDVSGVAGVGLLTQDTWTPGSHVGSTTWDWYAALAAAGSPFAPGLLDWTVGGDYRNRHDYYLGQRTQSNGLAFHAGLTLLGQRESPLVFRLEAGRQHDEFTTSGQYQSTGSSDSTIYGASAYYREANRPNIGASVSRSESTGHGFGVPDTKADLTRLSLTTGHGAGNFSYTLSYDLSWADGTYDVQNYRSQQLGLRARARLSPTAEMFVSESYFQRTPTGGPVFNPSYDDQMFGADVIWAVSPQVGSRTSYSYGHFSVKDSSSRESIRNSLVQGLDWYASPTLKLSGTGSFDATESRLDATSTRGYGAYASAMANWQRPAERLTVSIDTSATAGYFQGEGTTSQAAFGASASGGLRWSRDLAVLGAGYSFGASTNTGGLGGWGISQQLTLDGNVQAGDDWRFTGLASASGGRSHSDATHTDAASRQLTLQLTSTWRRWSAQLAGAQSEGLSGDLANPLRGDGLFLGTNYNGSTRSASLSLTAPSMGGLNLSLIGRWLSQTFPDRSERWERGVGVIGSYVIGAFSLSVEDRWSEGGSPGVTSSGNLFMVRLSRSFGARF